MLALLLWSCTADDLPLDGDFAIQGEGPGGGAVLGAVHARPGGGCQPSSLEAELYGPSLHTAGTVPATVDVGEGGEIWLFVPVRTFLGDGTAALRIQGREALLPLGARPGEFDLHLAWTEGAADAEALSTAAAAAVQQVEAGARAWQDGAFRLHDDQDQLVGEILLRGDAPAAVSVHDRTWWTEGFTSADRFDDGPELVLSFGVQPALQDEDGMLRLNPSFSQAVVPADRLPTDVDRHLRLVPGAADPAERAAARERAVAEADAAERELLGEVGRELAVRARTPEGGCRSWQEAGPQLARVFAGYDVRIDPEGGECVVTVQPTLRQHRRRLSLRIDGAGIRSD